MHLILPVAEMAQELQGSFHSYLKKHDNPLLQEYAKSLDATNRQELKYRQAEVLTARLQFFRECLSNVNRRYEIDSPQHKLIGELWDESERYGDMKPFQIRQFNPGTLDLYIKDITSTIDRMTTHVRVKGRELQNLGKLPEIPLDPVVLTVTQCAEIIRAIIDDTLNQKMIWVPKIADDNPHLNATMQKFFPQWDGKDEQHASRLPREHAAVWREQAVIASDHAFHRVIRPVINKINRLIAAAIPDETWQVWTVRPVGRDVGLLEGQDWRVLDWNRRMRNGEWSLNDAGTSETLDPEFAKVKVRTKEILDNHDRHHAAQVSLGLDTSLFVTPDAAPAPQVFKVAPKADGKKRRA